VTLLKRSLDGSDSLRGRVLSERGIELACPHRRSRKQAPLQDARKLRQ
jgi:hypothetical protein